MLNAMQHASLSADFWWGVLWGFGLTLLLVVLAALLTLNAFVSRGMLVTLDARKDSQS